MDLRLRPLRRQDFPLLSNWLAAPHVQPWWREAHDLDSIESAYGPSIDGDDPTEIFIVERGDAAVGIIQRYLISDNPGWERSLSVVDIPQTAAGIDYLIGDPAQIGQGLGPRIIERFAQDTWRRYPSAPTIVVAIHQDNTRSWRAVEKSGFERIWDGLLDSDDPSDEGPHYIYVRHRTCH